MVGALERVEGNGRRVVWSCSVRGVVLEVSFGRDIANARSV